MQRELSLVLLRRGHRNPRHRSGHGDAGSDGPPRGCLPRTAGRRLSLARTTALLRPATRPAGSASPASARDASVAQPRAVPSERPAAPADAPCALAPPRPTLAARPAARPPRLPARAWPLHRPSPLHNGITGCHAFGAAFHRHFVPATRTPLRTWPWPTGPRPRPPLVLDSPAVTPAAPWLIS